MAIRAALGPRDIGIHTPSGFDLESATVCGRLVAFLIDSAILAIITIFVILIEFPVLIYIIMVQADSQGTWLPIWALVMILAILGSPLFAVWIGYLALLDSPHGDKTIGKAFRHIAVVALNGDRISLIRSMVRAAVKLIPAYWWVMHVLSWPSSNVLWSWVLVDLGVLNCLLIVFTPRRRALHDLVAGTVVVEW